jgi:hypothetical protein
MSEESMASRSLEKANKLYAIGMKNIKIQMALIGTEFVVLRPKSNSKWKNVFGGSYSSDSTLENDYEQFTTKLIINQNELKDVWNRNRDTLESYSPDGSLNVGDELQYTRNKRTYRFKIILKQGYSEDADVLFVYTLSSIIETINEDRDE